jgi:hypothetical protein
MVNTLLCAASENAELFIIEYFKVLNGIELLTTGVIGWILLIEGMKMGCSLQEGEDLIGEYAKFHQIVQAQGEDVQTYLTRFEQALLEMIIERDDTFILMRLSLRLLWSTQLCIGLDCYSSIFTSIGSA